MLQVATNGKVHDVRRGRVPYSPVQTYTVHCIPYSSTRSHARNRKSFTVKPKSYTILHAEYTVPVQSTESEILNAEVEFGLPSFSL